MQSKSKFQSLPEYTNAKSSLAPFVTDADWQLSETKAIVVDDLDPNFSVVQLDRNTGNFVKTSSPSKSSNADTVYIKGLPAGQDFVSLNEWHREFDPSSFGSYHRTYAVIARGERNSAAQFTVNLPQEGLWNLEYYVPRRAFGPRYATVATTFGIDWHRTRLADPIAPEEHYTLTIKDGDAEWDEEFDIANANIGWNDVGKFEFSSTEVEMLVSAWAGHKDIMVYVDAIRWTPVEPD